MKIFKKEYILLLILAALCLVFYFLFLGHYKLIDVDEPRYAEAAREMLKSGNWLTPYFNYELRFDKPVFFYWLIAISYMVFGVTEFAARFPTAVMATLLVFFTYFFGRQTISKSFGFISAVILASSLEFILLGRMSITDMTLSFFICATIFSGLLASFSIKKLANQETKGFLNMHSDKIYWCLAYLFSGLAVLTKGPIGFVLPAIIFAVCFLLTGSLKENLKLKYVIPGILIFFTVVTPWYYLIIKEHGMNFVNYFFLDHNLARFGGGKVGHEQPFYFYPLVLFLGSFPWVFYLISALIKYSSEMLKRFKDVSFNNIAVFKEADNNLKVIMFSIVWFFVIFLFFNASSAKMVSYILPLYPAVALLAGKMWNDYIYEGKNQKAVKYSSCLIAGMGFLMAVAGVVAFIKVLPEAQDLGLSYGNLVIPLLFFAAPVFLLVYILKQQKVKALFALVLMMAGIIVVAATNVMPVIYNSAQIDLVKYVNIAQRYNSGDNELVTYALKKPSLVFYFQKRVPYISVEEKDLLTKYLTSKKPVFIVIKKKDLKDFSVKVKYNLINPGKRYSLISNISISELDYKNYVISNKLKERK